MAANTATNDDNDPSISFNLIKKQQKTLFVLSITTPHYHVS